MEVITPKGVICVEYHDNPILRGGQVVGVQAILTDVTARKRATQLLREERDRVQRYLDIAGVMLVVIDTEERVGLINKKGCEILGCTEKDVLGKNWFDNFLPPRIRERTRAIFDGLMAGQADENEYAEGPVLTQDGRERIIGWHNTLLNDQTGRIIATLSSGEDITERRRAEEAYRSLVDHSLQGLVIFQDGKAIFANQAMAEITGYAIDEMLAMSAEQVRDFTHPEDREIVWQNYRRRLAGEPAPEHYEMRGIRKDGSVCWLDIHASRIDYRGEPAVQAAYIDITEHKRAEEALRLSEERYRGIFENAVLGIYQTTPEGEILAANPVLVRVLGYDTFEELASRNLEQEGFEPEHPRSLFKDRIEADGQVTGLESAWKRRDGSTLWVRENARAVRDEAGKTLFYEGTVEDITKRKRAEEALCQSEELYRSLFENMLNGFAYCRMLFDQGRPLDFMYLDVNKAFEAQTGLKDVVGKKVSEVVPGIRESDPELFEIYGRVALTGRPEAFEIHVDAMKMWFSISVYSPQKEYFVAVFDVITERKEAEQRLRESETKYRELFENAREAIVILDLDKTITDVNRFVETYGFTKVDLMGRNYLDFVAQPYREKAVEDFELLRAGVPLEGEFEVITPRGPVVARYLDRPIVRGGHVVGVQSILTDITERKRAEQQLLDHQKRLRELATRLTLAEEQERRRIAVGVHDQIGQRLAMAKLTLQSLQTSRLETEISRALEEVCKDVDKVLEDAHSLTFELSNPILYEVGFEPAVESWLFQQVRDRQGIECTFEADESPVELDKETRVVLFDVVREILANVVKHAKAKHVDVRIRRIKGTVQTSVQDDGIGFQPPRTGTTVSESGGFGLFNIREKLDYLGGSITIESAPGEGTCVVAVVPLKSPRKSGKDRQEKECGHENLDRR